MSRRRGALEARDDARIQVPSSGYKHICWSAGMLGYLLRISYRDPKSGAPKRYTRLFSVKKFLTHADTLEAAIADKEEMYPWLMAGKKFNKKEMIVFDENAIEKGKLEDTAPQVWRAEAQAEGRMQKRDSEYPGVKWEIGGMYWRARLWMSGKDVEERFFAKEYLEPDQKITHRFGFPESAIEKAKLAAIEWRKKKEKERGGKKRRRNNTSGYEKISWNDDQQTYVVKLWNGKGGTRKFSVTTWGDQDAALEAAIEWRDDQIAQGNIKKSREPTEFVGVYKNATGSYTAQLQQCGEKREVTYNPKDFQDHPDPDQAAKDAAVAWRKKYENIARAYFFDYDYDCRTNHEPKNQARYEAFKSNPAPEPAKWVRPCDEGPRGSNDPPPTSGRLHPDDESTSSDDSEEDSSDDEGVVVTVPVNADEPAPKRRKTAADARLWKEDMIFVKDGENGEVEVVTKRRKRG